MAEIMPVLLFQLNGILLMLVCVIGQTRNYTINIYLVVPSHYRLSSANMSFEVPVVMGCVSELVKGTKKGRLL